MIKIGLTGGIGSGKTIVSRIFSAFGVYVYNADLEARRIMSSDLVIEKIASIYGSHVLTKDYKLDRKVLAGIVFNDERELKKLNSIVHPLVKRDFEIWVQQKEEEKYVIQESAILFESNFAQLFDKILVVSADIELRIQRVANRDGLSTKEITSRVARQYTDEQRESKSDYIIFNNESDLLLPQVQEIHESILAL